MADREQGHLGRLVDEQWRDWLDFAPSDRKIAARLKVSPSALGAWLRGTSMPKPENLQALAKFTGIGYERLLDAALLDHGYRDAAESG